MYYLIFQVSQQSQMMKSCQGRLANSRNTFSSSFVRQVSHSASADFSIPCCTALLFLRRCVSVGVERSEFMRVQFVLHSCLNLEPLGDQLQPYFRRGGDGWLAVEVPCRIGTVSYSHEWRCLFSTNCGVYI